ncbi:hypothetical protein Lpp228_00982 [Lacticaseibacillus paracasei subsp. paracasei Lpp228]|uniref:Uncharacterized protein n=1 Tax=Lacticaseibacillus paracasei subsp. paracasei Lpp49 TaxID=1256213 RepID=A0ABC9TCP5_LACPA|nr:hypothetical protein Lpp189_12392 [Lacticaseibacillus paracasei subsp. paracasei Lpp189]EPC68748.1 hypothetical protein Lpp228_00982 [Lacticaseibacillus paracasei subsp. paracasei Lpp228]EPC82789.1 hypothetical protein Lpp37_07099 [Lacticaseibacillus paracasei subsp. paracasei Lpp37]EPC91287.1 hypothetical protein Lpp49_06732 [Lacticaseibacillus paracasei subsp. paracasei Lpp49]EPD01859.1 hypothetical protein Lpp125_03499 [Lacticaseibacillus paracasei subsp. paracasei Lpp125]KTE99240.1 hypo
MVIPSFTSNIESDELQLRKRIHFKLDRIVNPDGSRGQTNEQRFTMIF